MVFGFLPRQKALAVLVGGSVVALGASALPASAEQTVRVSDRAGSACFVQACPWTAPVQSVHFEAPRLDLHRTLVTGEPVAQSRTPELTAAGTGRLVLRVEGAPAKASHLVSISGPAGVTREISQSTVLSVEDPGLWTVTARKISAGGFTYFPLVTATSAHLERAGSEVVTIDYADVVSDRILVVSQGALVSIGPGARALGRESDQAQGCNVDGAREIVLKPLNRLKQFIFRAKKVFDIAIGITQQTPNGALYREVCGPPVRSGGKVKLWVVDAPLSDLGPRETLSFSERYAPKLSEETVHGFQLVGQQKLTLRNLRCDSGVSGSFTPSFSFSPEWRFLLQWTSASLRNPGRFKASVSAGGTATAGFVAQLSTHGTCTYPQTTVLSLPMGGPFAFAIGPVPVVISPHLSFNVMADVNASGSVAVGARQSLDIEAGLTWTGTQLDRIWRIKPSSPRHLTSSSADASAGVTVGLDVGFLLYRLAGPTLGLSVAGTLKGSTGSGWSLWAGVGAKASLKLHFYWPLSKIFEKSQSLYDNQWQVWPTIEPIPPANGTALRTPFPAEFWD
jgi:hypothetical protein